MLKFILLLFFQLLLFVIPSTAQLDETYLFPIQPGQTASIAGTFGELRTNHFHSGIDIRTNNQIGYAVLAAKSGYVSKIGMSAGGYGNVLYITHPDGNTTVYAHLDAFKGRVADYVRKEQYRRKTFEIDLFFRKDQFPVKRGDTVAISGNTGSSSGPHLHFDIRDKDNLALDPLSFGFPEVVDSFPPYTEKIALKTLNTASRINDRFGRTEFYVQKNGSDFLLPYPIFAFGEIGIEMITKDRLAYRSPFFGGVNFIEVFVNNQLLFKQRIEKLDISEGRMINTVLNFQSLKGNNNKFYKLYVDDGNSLPFYDTTAGNGKISIKPGEEKLIKIITKDIFGKSSTLSFQLKGVAPATKLSFDNSIKSSPKVETIDNTLSITINEPYQETKQAIVYQNKNSQMLSPSYGGIYSTTYLINLARTLPDSIVIGNQRYVTNLKTKVPSGSAFTYYSDMLDVTFPESALYDTLNLQVALVNKQDSSEQITIGNPLIPLHRSITVSWKTKMASKWNSTSAVYKKSGGNLNYVGGAYTNGSIQFSTREFGSFTIVNDTIAPVIKPIIVNNAFASFRIKDNLSGIDHYEATINGQWLLMHLDGKTGTLRSEKLDKQVPLKGELQLTVSDRAGNKQVIKQQIH